MSIVTGSTLPQGDSTIAGNVFSRQIGQSCSGGGLAIEVGAPGTTVTNNQISNFCWGISISYGTGVAFFDNRFVIDTTASSHESFSKNGGYDATEWIGPNSYQIGGSGAAASVSGCSPDSPAFCTLGHDAYGTRPAIYEPTTLDRASAMAHSSEQ